METARFGPASFFVLENVGIKEALFSFGSRNPSRFRVRIAADDDPRIPKVEGSTGELNFFGRLRIGSLTPATAYTARCFSGDEAIAAIRFRTLPAPELDSQDAKIRFAVLADPHVSIDRENRRGRLFQESRGLLRETIETLNGNCQALLIPGDVTDKGKPAEAEATARILSEFQGELFMVPGDHDVGQKHDRKIDSDALRSLFEKSPFLKQWERIRILGLDTSECILPAEQKTLLEKALAGDGPLIILSHYNLLLNSEVLDSDSVVDNHDELKALFLEAKAPWILYTGHKNIPSRLEEAKGMQLNVPQLTHYPAGFLEVTIHGDKLLHQFSPIRSEALRVYSLKMLSVDSAPSHKPDYRYGSIEARSFIFQWKGN